LHDIFTDFNAVQRCAAKSFSCIVDPFSFPNFRTAVCAVAKKEGCFSLVRGWQPVAGYAPLAHTALPGMSERKEQTKLGLSKYAAEAAEQAAEHRDKLGIAGNVKDVADVHKTLWPDDHNDRGILNIAVLTGQIQPRPIPPGEEGHVPEVWARERLGNADPHS
jgi:hypothetical protein